MTYQFAWTNGVYLRILTPHSVIPLWSKGCQHYELQENPLDYPIYPKRRNLRQRTGINDVIPENTIHIISSPSVGATVKSIFAGSVMSVFSKLSAFLHSKTYPNKHKSHCYPGILTNNQSLILFASRAWIYPKKLTSSGWYGSRSLNTKSLQSTLRVRNTFSRKLQFFTRGLKILNLTNPPVIDQSTVRLWIPD